MDQVKFVKAVFHKFYLVHFWIICPICYFFWCSQWWFKALSFSIFPIFHGNSYTCTTIGNKIVLEIGGIIQSVRTKLRDANFGEIFQFVPTKLRGAKFGSIFQFVPIKWRDAMFGDTFQFIPTKLKDAKFGDIFQFVPTKLRDAKFGDIFQFVPT